MSQVQNVESGSTGLARGLTVLQSQRLSRAGLVYGSSFSRGSILDAAVRRQLAESNDMWYDIERFQLVSRFFKNLKLPPISCITTKT